MRRLECRGILIFITYCTPVRARPFTITHSHVYNTVFSLSSMRDNLIHIFWGKWRVKLEFHQRYEYKLNTINKTTNICPSFLTEYRFPIKGDKFCTYYVPRTFF